MFKKWITLTTADCEVIKFSKNLNIYPIFKNGRSSLTVYAKDNNLPVVKNKDISGLTDITVYIRDPIERFISGVHTFFYLNQLKINDLDLKKIDNFENINRHFMPQSIWLLHLYKFYENDISLKDVKEVYNLIPLREGPWYNNTIPWTPITEEQKNQIKKLNHKKFTDIDYRVLNKYLDKKINLKKIVKEITDALS